MKSRRSVSDMSMISFLQIAANFEFVTHALIAESAQLLAIVTKSTLAVHDAALHCRLAIQGLNRAIASFSKLNMDAVLCATISLLYQQTEW